MIRYVPHSAIDKVAWDARLEAAGNALWYGRSATLDAASPGWGALIDEAAGAQLAIPWRRKYGIRYAYQPFLIQQLGPFAPSPSPQDVVRFLQAWPGRFRYADIYLCAGDVHADVPHVKLSEQANFVRSLEAPIDVLRAGYSTNHRRSLKKAAGTGASYEARVPAEEVIAFIEGSEQFMRWGIGAARRAALRGILLAAQADGTGSGYGVREGGTLVAAAFFVRWKGRLIFLKGLASARGRELLAMHLLIDRVIADHAGTGLVLDFAGSNDSDLARFYRGFGAVPAPYMRALVNKLPTLLRRTKT
ncbi:MAG: GNAT family N-acetyltransferase [Flavobacteriales bacterium]